MNLRIEQDDDPMDPRKEFDPMGKMVCFHRRYSLGDEHDYRDGDYNGWDELEAAIRKEENVVVMRPIFMYDHSGVTINTGGFSCPWDSGRIGMIYATREGVLREYGKKRVSKKMREEAEKRLEAEVVEYDQYLRGDCWGYIVEDHLGEQLDSCWGFFGREYCEQEGKEQLAYFEAKEAQREPSFIPAPVCAVA